MNPVLAAVIAKNGSDIEAIVNKIGVANLLALMPHIMAIMATIDAQKPK